MDLFFDPKHNNLGVRPSGKNKLYFFYQNNSHGKWEDTASAIIVEENDGSEATRKYSELLDSLYGYEDVLNNHNFCKCCGERWDCSPTHVAKGTSSLKIFEDNCLEEDLAKIPVYLLDKNGYKTTVHLR